MGSGSSAAMAVGSGVTSSVGSGVTSSVGSAEPDSFFWHPVSMIPPASPRAMISFAYFFICDLLFVDKINLFQSAAAAVLSLVSVP